jgi:chromosome condensin MukBEF ATPase and DNA-binding subunit MukB
MAKALKSVVERNKLSMGKFSTFHNELWVEAHQAANELDDLERRLALEEHLRENAETSYSVVYNMNTELRAKMDEIQEAAKEALSYFESFKAATEGAEIGFAGVMLGGSLNEKMEALAYVLSKYSKE